MVRASKMCNEPGCPEIIPLDSIIAYCPEHAPPLIPGWGTSKRVKPSNWHRTQELVMRRDNYRCVFCGRRARVVDHKIPQAWGGTEALENLRAMCGKCHRAKGIDESQLGRKFARASEFERHKMIREFTERW